jgi:hypothetical protein
MPKLMSSCYEAAVAHWELDTLQLREPQEAAQEIARGRLSKAKHPSAAHAGGQQPNGRNGSEADQEFIAPNASHGWRTTMISVWPTITGLRLPLPLRTAQA